MQGTIQNRDAFLNKIAKQLGRQGKTEVEIPTYQYHPQDKVLQGATQDDLVIVLKEQCKNINTDVIITSTEELPNSLQKVVQYYGGKSIITSKDSRFEQYGLSNLMDEWLIHGIDFYVWNAKEKEQNVHKAENANIGITISEITLAESGTTIVFSDKDRGRTINFLPEKSIFLVPKSTIVPRMTQGARLIREKIKNGEQVASCINFITGPSNSADIEMIPVVGVHGPIKATYIIVEDQ
ncbi:LutC/YkgG family protein [Rummeliibacillus sp. JY-2-4R]